MTHQRTITIAAAVFVAVLAAITTQSTVFAVHAGPSPTPKHVSLHDQIAIHIWSSLAHN